MTLRNRRVKGYKDIATLTPYIERLLISKPRKKNKVLKGESTVHLYYAMGGDGKVWDRLINRSLRVGAGIDAAHSD